MKNVWRVSLLAVLLLGMYVLMGKAKPVKAVQCLGNYYTYKWVCDAEGEEKCDSNGLNCFTPCLAGHCSTSEVDNNTCFSVGDSCAWGTGTNGCGLYKEYCAVASDPGDPSDPSDPSDPGDPGSGTPSCTWCTSPSNCEANGGTVQNNTTYCSSSTDRPCCANEYDPCETGNRCNVDPTWECCDWIGQWSTCNHTWTEGYYACANGWCGDGVVNNGETCLTCPQDAGSCQGNVSGIIYIDHDNSATLMANGNCRTPNRTRGNASAVASVRLTKGSYTRADGVDSNGNYLISNITYGNDFALMGENIGGDYRYSCPPAGLYTDVDVNSTTDENVTITRDFYVSRNQDPWFSVMGGEVKANGQGGTTLRNRVPSTCSGSSCFTSRRLDGGVGSSGPMLTAGGGGSIVGADEDGRGWIIADGVQKRRETFDYFKRQYDLGLNPTQNIPHPDPVGYEVDGQPRPGEVHNEIPRARPGGNLAPDVYWVDSRADNKPWIVRYWHVRSGEKYVVFVDGDLLIHQNMVVDPGGFLAFIVKGNIAVNSDYGYHPAQFDVEVPLIQGVYIADGTISTETLGDDRDRKMVFGGTFVGWSGVSLDRDLEFSAGSTGNTVNPAELFIYRPDFLFNLPDEMKTVRYLWQEVAPGGDIELRPGQDAYGN